MGAPSLSTDVSNNRSYERLLAEQEKFIQEMTSELEKLEPGTSSLQFLQTVAAVEIMMKSLFKAIENISNRLSKDQQKAISEEIQGIHTNSRKWWYKMSCAALSIGGGVLGMGGAATGFYSESIKVSNVALAESWRKTAEDLEHLGRGGGAISQGIGSAGEINDGVDRADTTREDYLQNIAKALSDSHRGAESHADQTIDRLLSMLQAAIKQDNELRTALTRLTG